MSFPIRFVFAFASLALVFSAGCSKKSASATAAASNAPQKQPVEVVAVERRDLVESLSLVGSLAPNETAQLRAEISGQVLSVLFEEGQQVKKGQVLLKVDDSELRAQLAQAESRLKLAELNYKRSQDLTEARSLSQAEADRTNSDYSSAQAESQLLRVRLAKMEIKAPFDGTVGARTISPGDYITAATVITTLDDLSRLKIDFQVPERFTSKIASGTKFSIRAQTPTGDAKAEGEVYFISSVIDRSTRSSQVKGYVTGNPKGFQPGMFAGIELVLAVHKGVLTVPEGAILTTPTGTQVITVLGKDGEKVAGFVKVTLGLRERGLVEITPEKPEDLPEKQEVVASGVGALILFPGVKLEPRPLRVEFRVGE
ncbi:efflux RND transporter periplasmic adaptor subunit [Oleiharenicola lentus]|uniref:efflux RND transporter periplasmic adaptor subunit n=1 Tax=Oleiharenicola lentus TaxID=2508720 RepID=UPI003F6704EE